MSHHDSDSGQKLNKTFSAHWADCLLLIAPTINCLLGSVWYHSPFCHGLFFSVISFGIFVCKLALIATNLCFYFKHGHSSLLSLTALWSLLTLNLILGLI